MTMDQAMKLAKANPGHAIRAKGMQGGWKIVYLRVGKNGGFFAINPNTGTDYAFTPSLANEADEWVHA